MMNKITAFTLILLVFTVFSGFAENLKEINNLDRVEAFLSGLAPGGFTAEKHSLLESSGGFGNSLILSIPGSGEGNLILAVPLCDDFAVLAGLMLIGKSTSGKTDIAITVAFLGDEKTSLPVDAKTSANKGLTDLLQRVAIPQNHVLLYLDIDEAPEAITIHHGDDDYLAPLGVIKPFLDTAKKNKIKAGLSIRYNEFHQLNLAGKTPELALSWANEINSLYICSAPSSGNEKITASDLAELIYDYANSIDLPVTSPDRHYYIINLPGTSIFLSEWTSILIIISLAALLVILILVYFTSWQRRVFIRRFGIKFFFQHFWIFLLFLPVLALLIKGSAALYGLFLFLLNKPNPDADYPGIIIAMSAAIILFVQLLRLPDYSKPPKGNFYALCSFFYAIIGLYSSVFFDLGYTPFFVWTAALSLMGLVSVKPLIIIIFAVLIPLPAMDAFLNLWKNASGSFPYAFFAQSGFRSWILSFQLALIIVPSLLLLKKGMLSLLEIKEKEEFIKPLFRIAIPAFFLLLLFIYTLILPGRSIPPARPVLTDKNDLLNISVNETVYEESRLLRININAVYEPQRYIVLIENIQSGRPVIYSSPSPLEERQSNVLELILGENPPNPLELELVLGAYFNGSIIIEALYTDGSGIDPDYQNDEDYLLRLTSSQKITGEPYYIIRGR